MTRCSRLTFRIRPGRFHSPNTDYKPRYSEQQKPKTRFIQRNGVFTDHLRGEQVASSGEVANCNCML